MNKFNGSAPLITCSGNGWGIPAPMLDVHDFTDCIDHHKPEYIQLLKNQQKIFTIADRYLGLNSDQRKVFIENKQMFI